jgi:hypothetical protein
MRKIVISFLTLSFFMFIPNYIMAQSTNTLTKNTLVQAKGYQFSLDNASRIKIDLKEPIQYNGTPIVFYVNLEGAKWLDTVNSSVPPTYFTAATFKKINDTKLEVKIGNSLSGGVYYIPLLTELTGGKAEVSVDGAGTKISSMAAVPFAITSEQKAVVSVGDIPAVREEGIVANIKIDELIKGDLVDSSRSENRTIKLTLLHSNYEFENEKPAIQTSGGFSDMITRVYNQNSSTFYEVNPISTSYGRISSNQPNKSILYIYLPEKTDTKSQGKLNITDLKVKAVSKEIRPGKIQIQVTGPNVQESTVTVAEIKDYSVAVINKLNEPASIKVGNKNAISFSIKENVLDSMVVGKTVQVTLDKGYFAARKKAGISDVSIGNIKLNKQDMTKQVSLNGVYRDDFLVGFNFDIPKSIDSSKLNEIEFNDVQVYAPKDAAGNVKLLAHVVGLKEDASAVVAVIKPISSVNMQSIRLKVGLKDQVGGKIIITETDKDMIQEGILELEIEAQEGITFSKEPQVTVISGDIKLGDVRYDGIKPNMLKIDVLRTSKNASSIEIKNFVITTDRMVPDGGYKLSLKGSALALDAALGAIEYDNFMIVGDVQIASTPKTTSRFTMGSEFYYVNGEMRNMDAKAYAESGRTMVPLRYVADAVGITSKDITFSNNAATIRTLQKTIILYPNESAVQVNNEKVMISGQVVTKAGRTYVPIAEIAKLLDVKVTWDADTKTAIFEK